MGRIYLDHHATTPVDPAVVAAMLPFFTERFGNPSGRSHAFAAEAGQAVEEARERLAALVGARPEEIVFTSGATEADNLAVRGGARSLARKATCSGGSLAWPSPIQKSGFGGSPNPAWCSNSISSA